MIKKYFLANGTLGELNESQSNPDWLRFYCINGNWKGEISSDGKQIRVNFTGDTHDCSLLWTDDDIPDGDYNTVINEIRKSLGYAA